MRLCRQRHRPLHLGNRPAHFRRRPSRSPAETPPLQDFQPGPRRTATTPSRKSPSCSPPPPWQRPWLWDQAGPPVPAPAPSHPHLPQLRRHGPAAGSLLSRSCTLSAAIATLHDWHMFADERLQPRNLLPQHGPHPHPEKTPAQNPPHRGRRGADQGRHHAASAASTPIASPWSPWAAITSMPSSPESWNMENFVLSVGDTPNKNLALARDALSQLRAKFIHLNWVIVGNRQNIEARLAPLENGILPPGSRSWKTPPTPPSRPATRRPFASCSPPPAKASASRSWKRCAWAARCSPRTSNPSSHSTVTPGQLPPVDPAAWADRHPHPPLLPRRPHIRHQPRPRQIHPLHLGQHRPRAAQTLHGLSTPFA